MQRNAYINNLLIKLKSSNHGVRINKFHLNVLAYADDLNLISTTPIGLQSLINICNEYAKDWKMNFNPVKTNIVCIGKQTQCKPPVWLLGDTQVGLSEDASVLGVTFTSSMSYGTHVKNRIRKCQQGIFGLTSMGLSYPGLNSDVKAFLWNTIGSPTLIYGMESISLSKSDFKNLKTTQGNIIKRFIGVNKRAHHSDLFRALNITSVENVIKNNCLRLYQNIFKADTPARDFQSVLLTNYILEGKLIKGTLLYKVVNYGQDPLKIIFDHPSKWACTECEMINEENGLTDSLKYLLNHEEYNKPWSEEHILVTLLTKAY